MVHEWMKRDLGSITVGEWCRAMQRGTRLSLPWRMLREKFIPLDPITGLVEYNSLFHEFPTDFQQLSGDTKGVEDAVFQNRASLETIFNIMDTDNSGTISMEEFSTTCELMSQYLPSSISPSSLLDIAESIDINKDGKITLNEFLEAFRLSQHANRRCPPVPRHPH
ncbi:unnamed protein product [Darwinula stevensoni]|uniref:EF-hand domain-containing protein n=1 Tax=Darwinula stevensoni TaxID=69355 RepID=A0A7R9FRN2_9CRUS|nr:unnamed protein product [Darwinula stevensoni]CAG0901330.1 unnamed protein product [Darwinula stevensoni]